MIRDEETGEIVELRCTYDPETRGGDAPDGRKVKATLHWVSASHALNAEVRLYNHLFTKENPSDTQPGEDVMSHLNPESLEVVNGYVEPGLKGLETGTPCQFERLGYFCVDPVDSSPDALVFNRTVTLRDTWAKIQKARAKQR